MESDASHQNPVQRFAEIMAALADPFAERTSVLSAAGYDAASWERVESEWTHRIEQDPTGELGATFARAFAQASRAAADDTWPGERDLDRTAELCVPRLPPTLPFSAARTEEESGVRRAPAPRRIHEPPIRAAEDETERTMEVPVYARRVPVLPFEPSRTPSGRLHRFDTQTGLPLPNPVWADDDA